MTLTSCLCCDGRGLAPYLDLGLQPLANSYHRPGENVPRFPLVVNLCMDCKHSQLSLSVDPQVMFGRYLYVSGTTATFRGHCADLAREASARFASPPAVLDIGCNDGTLLEAFRALGSEVHGVDPAEDIRPLSAAKGFSVEVGMWPERRIALGDRKFDLVTGLNVFAHCPDPAGFLRAAREVLRPGGLVVVEFPYGGDLFLHGEFDTIYHEHLSYFTAGSFSALAERCEYSIVAAARTAIHGGSVRFYLSPSAHGSLSVAPEVDRMRAEEVARGLNRLRTYYRFSAHVDETREEFNRLLAEQPASGRKLVAYGASAKGSTAANYFGMRGIEYAVDDNPRKVGLLTPGLDWPIVGPEVLATEPGPLAFVLTAWNFEAEIRQRIARARGADRGDRFLSYVPRAKVSE